MALWLVLSILGFADWEIVETGLFRPLPASQIATDETGFYIPHASAGCILRFDYNGNRLADMGRRGDGPGEFSMLLGVFVADQRVYGRNLMPQRLEIFQLDGKHERTLHLPPRVFALAKVKQGWVLAARTLEKGGTERVSLSLSDSNFNEIRQLQSWRSPERMLGQIKNGVFVMPFNPAHPFVQLGASPAGDWFFLVKPNGNEVQFFDADSGALKRILKLNLPRLPFDRDWAEEKRKAQLAELNSRPRSVKLKLKPSYPNRFPAIERATLGPDDQLWVFGGDHYRNPEAIPILFDANGERSQVRWTSRIIDRVIRMNREWAFVTTFASNDEEFGIKRVLLEDLHDFIEKNPVTLQGF